jgi:hypothetical protein
MPDERLLTWLLGGDASARDCALRGLLSALWSFLQHPAANFEDHLTALEERLHLLEARAIAKEDFAIEKDTSELKAKWYDKMTQALSERTGARFFHIDEKLDAAADIALAVNIPLIH